MDPNPSPLFLLSVPHNAFYHSSSPHLSKLRPPTSDSITHNGSQPFQGKVDLCVAQSSRTYLSCYSGVSYNLLVVPISQLMHAGSKLSYYYYH